MGPTPKQVIGIVLICVATVAALPFFADYSGKSDHALLACGLVSVSGVVLLVKGGRRA